MKKVGIITLVLVLLLGLGTMAAYARAQKVSLDGAGWVIVNKNAAGQIIVEVHLDASEPNTDFYVFIKNDNWSWTGDDTCRHGQFTTNKRGKGNFHGTISSEGVTDVQVVVRTPYPAMAYRYETRVVDISEIEPPT